MSLTANRQLRAWGHESSRGDHVVAPNEAEQVEDPDSISSGDDDRRPSTDQRSHALPAAVARPWARGLTPDGEARFETWSREQTSMNERRLYHEMERQALARGRAGDPVYTWERVEEAIEDLDAARRREIEDEVRQKLRPAVIEEVREVERRRIEEQQRIRHEELRQAELSRRVRRRWRWFASATLTTAATSVVAVLSVEAPAWQKVALVGIALGGAWLAGPGRHDTDDGSADPRS